MARTDCDVVIVGAGMVGAALARLLLCNDFSVAIVEKEGLIGHRDPATHDLRVSAINPASERILSAAGAWERITQTRASPYLRMFVWDACSSRRIEFDSADLGVSHLGTIVENNLVAYALHRQLDGAAGVRVVAGCAVEDLRLDRDRISLALAGGNIIRARLLIGADGARSWVRRQLGIRSRTRDFKQLGIVATVATEGQHEETAWQRFLPTGPLAFLPLSDGRCSIVWSCRQERAEELAALDDDRFATELTGAFEHRLGAVTECGPRKTFSLRSSHAERYIGERAVLVGDAAHVVHPLAGQGVNLGFQDAAALAQVMTEARDRGRDIGGSLTLRRYERWRKGENLGMYHAMNGIERLFGAEHGAVALVRGMGLRVTDSIGPLKAAFALRAMGFTGDLPEAAARSARL